MSIDNVLDPATVADLRRAQEQFANPAFISQLVDLFRENAPRRMDQIREAIAAGDAATLERVAHALKTNCAMLGARLMADACARLEAAGWRSDFEEARRVFAEAELQFPHVLEAVAALTQ